MALKLEIVVACANNLGIGFKNQLPWRLRGDMDHFKRVTCASVSGKQNAVIMGRNTYFSIPEKFRPLSGRVNIVLSSTLNRGDLPESVYLLRKFDDIEQLLLSSDLPSKIDKVFIIGGSSVYKEAMDSPLLHRIYLTRIFTDVLCDAFLPRASLPDFKRILVDGVPVGKQTEAGLDHEFQVYQKKNPTQFDLSFMVSAASNMDQEPQLTLKIFKEMNKCFTEECIGGKVVYVKADASLPGEGPETMKKFHSYTLEINDDSCRSPDSQERITLPSLAEALTFCKQLPDIGHVCITGGYGKLMEALKYPEFATLYMAEIDSSPDVHKTHPEHYQDLFTLSRLGESIEENGVTYRINIYKRKSYDDAFDKQHDSQSQHESRGIKQSKSSDQ